MTLYRVTVPVTAETYAHTPEEAAEQVKRAISVDTRLAAPEPGTPLLGDAAVAVNPERNGGSPPRRAPSDWSGAHVTMITGDGVWRGRQT